MRQLKCKHRLFFYLSTLLVVGLMMFLEGCRSSQSDGKTTDILFKDNVKVYDQWNDIFAQDTLLSFSFDDPKVILYAVSGLNPMPNGEGYIVGDGKAHKTIQFDANGKFVRYIGCVGEGPGCLNRGVGKTYFDKKKNLYIYDALSNRINKYIYPDFHYEKTFFMKYMSQDTMVDPNGNFIHYTTSDPSMLIKFDSNYKVIKKAFQVNNLNFRLFSSRFWMGRMGEIPGEGFIFSYPEAYKVYLCDYDLNIKKTFSPESYSKFLPAPAVFPNRFNPGEYSPAMAKWWGSELRTSLLFYVENGFFLQEVEQFINMDSKVFMNLHDLSGITYARGMQLPYEGGYILCVAQGYVYALEDSVFDEKGNTTDVKIHRYRLKSTLKQGK